MYWTAVWLKVGPKMSGPDVNVPAPRPVALTLAGQPLGVLAWLLMSVCYWPALRFYGRSPLWAPLLPLIAAFYMGCTIHSAVQYWRGAGGQWKGRAQAIIR